jgi:hypothetical protein
MNNDQIIDQAIETPYPGRAATQTDLTSSGGTLAMGIVSIIFCLGLIGVILAFMTLSRTKQALHYYKTSPEKYTYSSFRRMKAARICAMVSLGITGSVVLIMMVLSSFRA